MTPPLDLVLAANADGERALAVADLTTAANAFTTALDHLENLDPTGEELGDLVAATHVGIGRVHLACGDTRAADLSFDQVQRLRPDKPDGFYWAGCTAAHAANYARAEWLLSAALDRDTRHGRSYLQRAYVHLRQRRPAQALPDLLAAADNQVTDDTLTEQTGDVPAVDLVLVTAVAWVLGGRRAEAGTLLARAAVRDGADHRVSHAQAALHLHTLGAAGHGPVDLAAWRGCLGAWMSVLHDKAFWARWRARAGRRYDRSITDEEIDAARSAFGELLEHRLPSPELAPLLRRERAAAALLARVGGLPVADPAGRSLVCGPLRVAELGLHQRLGEFLRDLPPDEDQNEGVRTELLRQFSEIGLALAQLTEGRTVDAALAVLDLRCPSCRSGGRTHPAMISEPLMCDPECTEFDRRNPAFCAFPDKHGELAKASSALATRTLLDIAREDIRQSTMDLADARTCWRGAVTLANRFNQRDTVLREITGDALGRARVLSGRGDLTGAVDVLDAALTAIPARDTEVREQVTTELCFLLNARGVALFNEDTANADQAHEDLSRAVALGPGRARPRLNLALLLREMAFRSFRRFDGADSIRLLSESVRHLEIGVTTHRPERFRDELELTRQELRRMLGAYLDDDDDGPEDTQP